MAEIWFWHSFRIIGRRMQLIESLKDLKEIKEGELS
jgi:hypothetical protein